MNERDNYDRSMRVMLYGANVVLVQTRQLLGLIYKRYFYEYITTTHTEEFNVRAYQDTRAQLEYTTQHHSLTHVFSPLISFRYPFPSYLIAHISNCHKHSNKQKRINCKPCHIISNNQFSIPLSPCLIKGALMFGVFHGRVRRSVNNN